MTESGSGQRDDQGQGPDQSGQAPDADDYRPSASWETSRGSSWENTRPYESGPTEGSWPTYPSQDQPQGYGSAGSYGSASDPYGQPTAPSQPAYGPADYGQPPQGYGQPGGYGQAGGYGQQGYDQPPYDQGQQAPYGVTPYQQPGYGGYVQPNHPKATLALILGIIGVALCPFAGIGGFIVGRRTRAEIDASQGQWGGRGFATAGWVMGIISIVLAAIWIVYLVVVIVIAASSTT